MSAGTDWDREKGKLCVLGWSGFLCRFNENPERHYVLNPFGTNVKISLSFLVLQISTRFQYWLNSIRKVSFVCCPGLFGERSTALYIVQLRAHRGLVVLATGDTFHMDYYCCYGNKVFIFY